VSPDAEPQVDWERVELVVFDLDGTLYDAVPLRRRMLLALVAHCLSNPSSVLDVRILRQFRITRESLAMEEIAGIGRAQFERPATLLGIPPEKVESVVRRWMFEHPLRYLARYRFPGVRATFRKLGGMGVKSAILSDYPARRKLAALGLDAEIVVTALDPEIDRLKPQTEGLQRVVDLSGLDVDRCVFVGDREETDGRCARRMGMPFLRKVGRPSRAPHEFSDYRVLVRDMGGCK